MNKIFFLPALFLASLLPTTDAFPQSAAKLAGIEQDLAILQQDVQRLREEVQDLRAAIAKVQNNSQSTGNSAALQQQMTALNSSNAQLEARVNLRMTKLVEEVNQALARQNTALNKALAETGAGKKADNVKTADSPPKDMPSNGSPYTVKPNDTFSKIARANRSRIAWIVAANNMTEKTVLRPGQVLFLPQRPLQAPEASNQPPPAN